MSRSFRKFPFVGVTGVTSEKKNKQAAHQVCRMHFRTELTSASDLDAFQFEEANKAHSNAQHYGKEGKPDFSLRVRHVGRAVQALANPFRFRSDRQLHKALAK